MEIAEQLRGKRFFVTGGTGFLGTALIERILRSIPDSHVVALIRPGRRSTAAERANREIIKSDCFDRLRREHGDAFNENIARRLTAVQGDVSLDGLGLDEEGLDLLATCDVVVHSAATVNFDSPIDLAVAVNLLGPSRVAATVGIARSRASKSTRRTANRKSSGPAHLIAVSTAYVAGTQQGETDEVLLADDRYTLQVDWKAEVESAERMKADRQAESRRPERLTQFAKEARQELGPAGIHLVAARAEKNREDWVKSELTDAGVARAQALGWPDAYAFTKALGEMALVSQYGTGSRAPEDGSDSRVPITIVRPSIIESALSEPHPGWIRGFRMAEPIIISYAKGLLREFPGVPEGVIDVIPVDLVVAAIIAIAAHGPEQSGPSVYHVASGVRNPFLYGRLVELCEDWFGRHPLYDDRGQPISVPDWSFPGRGRVQRQLQRATTLMDQAEKVLTKLPLRGRQASWAARLEDRHTVAKRALGYVELYGAYTETEVRYRVDRLLSLWERLGEEDRRDFCFDPAEIDWDHYVQNVHLPSVVKHGRVRTSPGRSTTPDRGERARRAILSPERHLAIFDLENTLIASNVVDSYAWLASRHLPADRRSIFVAKLLSSAPGMLALDRRDRGDFLRSFYRRYENAPVASVEHDSWELFHRFLLERSFPAGIARVREHRRMGHRTLLVTGALDFVVEPFRALFDDVACAHMGQKNGRFSGQMQELPPIGEARALYLARYAEEHGLSLAESVAYADAASDLAMLEAVGYPVAVNPDTRLAALARRRGWHVEHWEKAKGGSHRPLPLGSFDRPGPGRQKLSGVLR